MKEKILINVNQLLDGDRKIRLKLAPDPQYHIKGHVDVDLTLSRSEDSVFVNGTIKFTHKLQCSRCLKEILKTQTEKIEVHYAPFPILDKEIELTEEDVNTIFYRGNLLDLDQPIRDAIILSIPIKPLCKPDCKGLCPRCGKDLNEGKCDCAEKAIDPRWKALEKLLH